MHFNGITIFRNNIGYRGGAMYFFNTKMYLANQSKVIFQNNILHKTRVVLYMYKVQLTMNLEQKSIFNQWT